MIKIFVTLISVLFIISCSNQEQPKQPAKEMPKLAVLTFLDEAPKHINKEVMIEGTVFHTCKHGGKRMFLIDNNDSVRVEVTAGKNIPKFDEKLVGSDVQVIGIVKEERVDEKYLSEWETEVRKKHEKQEGNKEIHSGARGHEDAGIEDKLEEINDIRQQIKASGRSYLSFFSIEATTYKEVKK